MKLFAKKSAIKGLFTVIPTIILRYPAYRKQLYRGYSLTIRWGYWYAGIELVKIIK